MSKRVAKVCATHARVVRFEMSAVEAAAGLRPLLHLLRKGADFERARVFAEPRGRGLRKEECVISPQVGG